MFSWGSSINICTQTSPYCPPGFEKNQAEIIVSALVTLATANLDIVYKDMVTSSHQVGRQTMAVIHTHSPCHTSPSQTWSPPSCFLSSPLVLSPLLSPYLRWQEVALQQILAHLDAVRKDMVILEKSEFANLRSENEVDTNVLGSTLQSMRVCWLTVH